MGCIPGVYLMTDKVLIPRVQDIPFNSKLILKYSCKLMWRYFCHYFLFPSNLSYFIIV